jgi:hypothetical protein
MENIRANEQDCSPVRSHDVIIMGEGECHEKSSG